MKRIIDNLLYDTDTAELLYYSKADRTSYYRTPNQRYFVVYSNEEFEIVNEDFVKSILGKYDIDKYIEVFGKPQEG